jgi:hypothetical protein
MIILGMDRILGAYLMTGPVQPGTFQGRSLPHFLHSDDRVKRTGFNGHGKAESIWTSPTLTYTDKWGIKRVGD